VQTVVINGLGMESVSLGKIRYNLGISSAGSLIMALVCVYVKVGGLQLNIGNFHSNKNTDARQYI
jgi:hypothetical protein